MCVGEAVVSTELNTCLVSLTLLVKTIAIITLQQKPSLN